MFRKRFNDLEELLLAYNKSSSDLLHERKLFNDKESKFKCEKIRHEEHVLLWKKEVCEMKRKFAEQSDRLTLLSSELAGAKVSS